MLDSTVVRAHACAAGEKNRRRASAWSLARRLLQQAARFRRQPGQPLAFRLTAGQQGDAPQALPLLDGLTTTAVIADKAYDTDATCRPWQPREPWR